MLAWWIGHPFVAIGVAVILTASEAVIYCVTHVKGPVRQLSKDQRVAIMLLMCSANTFLYLYPALCLAGDPSLAMKMISMMWIMGIQVYIANTWSRVPIFLAAMLSPAMLLLIGAFFLLQTTAPEASSMTEWGIAMGFLVIFLYSVIDTLRLQLAAEKALFTAQTEAASRMAQLEESHRRDPLTGLLNRRAFDKALHVMLEDRSLDDSEVTVFLVDLDSFKPINDTYSHEAGDDVLVQTARRLQRYVADNGIVGRLGGDEFICAVGQLDRPDDALDYALSLSQSMSGMIPWNGRNLKVGTSIGIAMTGNDAAAPPATVSALCSAADQAMFAAKSSPNGEPSLYQKHLFAPRMAAEDKQLLVESIASGALLPFYQPKFHLPTGQIIGFEALARWDHPTKGVCQPSDFIYQINELGLQGDFMVSIVRRVIEDIQSVLALGLDPGQVSLNVPEVALATHSGRRDLAMIVDANPDVAPHLTFEITEDVFIARAADTIQASIATFRAQGVRISLDDFGTGFASFHHLRQLDFDELKIDTSFVGGLGSDATAEVLVRGFLSIASGLGVSVVAEGVETEQQRRDLINMGCMTAQGYLFSEAVPFSQATALLQQQQAA
jgi:diguanylate cyclase (GGDEF)-like protein